MSGVSYQGISYAILPNNPPPSAPPLLPPPYAPHPIDPVLVQIVPKGIPLHDAVIAGDIQTVRELLSQRVNVNEKDSSNHTAIAYAKNLTIIQELLNAGARIYPTTHVVVNTVENDTFLKALKQGDVLTVKDYIEKGRGDVHAKFSDDKTPLHLAVENGDPLLVLLLIRSGANLEARCDQGMVPLYDAGWYGKHEAAAVLLKEGAHVDALNNFGESPLHVAVGKGSTKVVSCLMKHRANVNLPTGKGLTPLILSLGSSTPYPLITTMLLEAGADIAPADNEGRTVLHFTAKHGLENLMLRFLDMGLPVDQASGAGKTPFLWAAWQGQLNMMKLLKSRNADVTCRDNQGWTALHNAAASKTRDCIEYAVSELGMNIHEPATDGHTPLQLAAVSGNVEGIRFLVEQGAPINAQDQLKKTALFLSVENMHLDAVRCLLQLKANPNILSLYAATYNLTPLHLAAHAKQIIKKMPLKHIQIARVLLECGAHIHAKGTIGAVKTFGTVDVQKTDSNVTPLHCVGDDDDMATFCWIVELTHV